MATLDRLEVDTNIKIVSGIAVTALCHRSPEALKATVANAPSRYLRIYDVLSDKLGVYSRKNKECHYNFDVLDFLFAKLLTAGAKPVVNFGYCPSDLAWSDHRKVPSSASVPVDIKLWAALIEAAARHWIERFGLEEVRTWYFEIWNKPNLKFHFQGTRSQYLELYRFSAQALKKVDSEVRVGGPATSCFALQGRFRGESEDTTYGKDPVLAGNSGKGDWQPPWIAHFLYWCAQERVPVDFVSCHFSNTDEVQDEHGDIRFVDRGADAFYDDLTILKQIVESSALPSTEIHLAIKWS